MLNMCGENTNSKYLALSLSEWMMVVLTLVPVDKTSWCDHSNETSSTALFWYYYCLLFSLLQNKIWIFFLSLTLVTLKSKRIKQFECYPVTSFVSSSILRFRLWIRIWMGLWVRLRLWIRLVGIWVWWLDRRRWLGRWRGLKSASASA